MCLNDNEIVCESRSSLTKRQRNLCIEELAINRDILCCVLSACKSSFSKPIKCLEGVGVCGIYGMLWKKHFGENVDVTINGVHEEDATLIAKNLKSNNLQAKVLNEDICILMRKESFDLMFLNCKTNTSHYLDSAFANIKDNSILVISTSEDSSLYWQAPEVALRNYGGVISKTSYHREVAVRLVIAEMARASARYTKGFNVLFTAGYKPQQSFTIVVRIKKGKEEATKCIKSIQKLAYCNLCEDRKFLVNSNFLDKVNYELSCGCSKDNEGKVILGIGPLWSGEIFDADFIQSMYKHSEELNCNSKTLVLLNVILQESRCFGSNQNEPSAKKLKAEENLTTHTVPYFYVNTHKHSSKELKLQKLTKTISLLQNNGFTASRTHFDHEAIRTNAPLSECVKIFKHCLHQS